MSENQDKVFNKTSINWYPGHMAKTKREIKEIISLIDIVFEVVDARIPYSSRNSDIDDIINNKPKVIIMTKSDLCDTSKTNKWKKYYEDKGYLVILMDLINGFNNKIIFDKISSIINEINLKRKNKGLKERKARILVLGIPNVGKSTLINRLVGKKATNVGNKPGITKKLEWIRINEKIELLDTPGILWPKLDDYNISHNLACTGAIKEEILDDSDIAVYIINKMLSQYNNDFKNRYKLENETDIISILDRIGNLIGAIRNNEVDYDRVYKRIINDFQNGYLGKITFDDI